MTMLGTYLLYYFVVFSSSILAYFSEVIRKMMSTKVATWLFFSGIIIPVLIAGYRYGIGTDYYSYSDTYHDLTSHFTNFLDAILNSRFEPGWIALNYFVKFIFNDVQYLFMISAILTWLLSFKAIYDNKNRISISLGILILLCTYYNISFNTVRQTISISIIMLSIKPLLDRRLFKFSLIILLASTFHYTAIIFFPAYWISNSYSEKTRLLKNIIIPLLFITLVYFIEPIISILTNFDIFSTYSNYDLEYRGFAKMELFLKLPIVILIAFNTKKLRTNNNPMYKISIFFLIGIILATLSNFADRKSVV